MLGTIAGLIFLTRTKQPHAGGQCQRCRGSRSLPEQPLVDVFICTYNEEEAILERTIIGALGIDYPRYPRVGAATTAGGRGSRTCASASAAATSRAPTMRHAKAGNINNALQHLAAAGASRPTSSPSSMPISCQARIPDARALALFREDDVGIVQTPQHFFNPDPIQTNLAAARVWPDEQRFFFDVVHGRPRMHGAAPSAAAPPRCIRFAPLLRDRRLPDRLGDRGLSRHAGLKEIGYRTVYLNEPLSLGLAPEGLKEYITQRSRWALGFMQICRGPSGPLSATATLSLIDRVMPDRDVPLLVGDALPSACSASSFRSLYLLFDVQAVHADVPDAISHLPAVLRRPDRLIAWLTQGRVLPVMTDVSQLLGATRYRASPCSSACSSRRGQKFQVTAKGGDRTQALRAMAACCASSSSTSALTVGGVLWAFLLRRLAARWPTPAPSRCSGAGIISSF